jgi:hypothetical protein
MIMEQIEASGMRGERCSDKRDEKDVIPIVFSLNNV